MSDLDSLKSIWQHLERPDGWGRAALEVRWAIIEIERLRADYDLLAARCKEAERLLRGASEVRCDNGNFDKDGFPTTCVDTQWHERANAWLAAAPGDEHE